MKSIVIYYSYSGNTRKVAQVLAEYLTQKGEVKQIELTALDESKSFLGQCRRALSRTRAKIDSVKFDTFGGALLRQAQDTSPKDTERKRSETPPFRAGKECAALSINTEQTTAFRPRFRSIDLTDFDLVCFGTPVWAFGPAPAMNACLDRCSGMEGKEVVLFTTFGSGTGNGRCLDYMQGILAKKGTGQFKRFSIQQFKVNDQNFILYRIKEVL